MPQIKMPTFQFTFPQDFVRINSEDYRIPMENGKLVRLYRKQGRAVIVYLDTDDTLINMRTVVDGIFQYRNYKIDFKLT